jgi:2-desacetyl-2-hydroxyethyl bacteriochlorophyllide A dehydrogenase
MKAIVLTSSSLDEPRRKAVVNDWADPGAPGVGQLRTRTIFSGVTNGTERNDMIRGNYSVPDESLPDVGVAYQNVGVVEAVGEGVTGFEVGDRVYSSTPHVEFVVQDASGLLTKLPAMVSSEHAALLGMTSVALRAVTATEVFAGAKVLVVGAGFVGQLMAQVANSLGADVTIADKDVRRLELARTIGKVNRTLEGDALQDLPEYAFDRVLDAAGVPGMETDLIRWTGLGGRVLLLAGRQSVSYDFNTGQFHEIIVQQTTHFTNENLASACAMVGSGDLVLEPLMDPVVAVDEAARAYDALLERPTSVLATVFRW